MGKPVHLLCTQQVSDLKKYNITHYETQQNYNLYGELRSSYLTASEIALASKPCCEGAFVLEAAEIMVSFD